MYTHYAMTTHILRGIITSSSSAVIRAAGKEEEMIMTSRNYNVPTVPADWADSRETDMAVATAIHAISGSNRSPKAIWEDPTWDEWDQVCMALEEYLRHGDFERSVDDYYIWGSESIYLPLYKQAVDIDIDTAEEELVECISPEGWSLHAPGSTDEEIATGDAPYILSGEGRPTAADRRRAAEMFVARSEMFVSSSAGGLSHVFRR